MSDGRVEFEITADGRRAFASIDQVTDALDRAGRQWERDARQSTDEIGNSFTGMLKSIATAISAAKIGQMLLSIGKDAIQAASDLQEVQNVVDVTFGDDAAKIESWAKNAGKQFGLTETQAKKFTSTLGAMMKSAGMSGDQLADISTNLSGLAADMASFYNLDFDTAFQKIRSGISGETEPLKQLGINMSVANLNAFALQKGLDKTFEKMSQGEQVMLRYQYLMQATADAQGDFARTSDGYANATRKLETNLESLKTKLGEHLLPAINDALTGFNNLMDALTGNYKETALDRFAAIDLKTNEKINQIKATAGEARTLTDVLDGIGKKIDSNRTEAGKMLDEVPDGKSGNLQTLGEELEKLAGKAEDNKTAIQGMTDTAPDGSKLNDTKQALSGIREEAEGATAAIGEITYPVGLAEEEYALWLETCERLTKTIPGLSDIIDAQTGSIKGGTDAVRAYIDEWERGQIGLAMRSAHQQKGSALDSFAAELPGLELNKTVAEYRLRKAREQLEGYMQQFGLGDMTADAVTPFEPGSAWAVEHGISDDNAKTLKEEIVYYRQLKSEAFEAREEYNRQKSAYEEAVAAYDLEGQAIEEAYGAAIESLGEWTDEQKEATTQIINSLDEALKSMKAYEDEVRKATKAQIENNISGFNRMKTAAEQAKEAANAYKTLEEQLKAAGKSGTELQLALDEANKQITAQGMRDALNSQLEWIREYQENLKTVRESGLIDDSIIAQLSDGSNESAMYLHALSEAIATGDKKTVEEINASWGEVNKGKEEFIDTLTKQKLKVDETYDAMVQKATEAAKALDVSGTAGESTGKNIEAMAQAIKDHVPDVAEQVDNVLKELNRLNGWGISFGLGSFGVDISIGNDINSHETGLNYVPFDGYLAQLHEGEGILNAEENRIWQAFKNGQRGVDYEALGGVMRDSIKPGGDVYLDGRIVGAVVSQMQGNQYRTMQRSGWQS